MDLKQLKYFVHVAEFGGFTKAAVALGVPQPTISRLVRQLEVQLRQNLLIRNGRGARLTEEGNVLLDHAKGILQQVERAHQDITGIKGSPIGKVIVGAPPTAGKGFILQLVSTFRERFPQASLELIEAKSWVIQEWLETGRIDIGILYDPRPSALIEITVLGGEGVFLVSSQSKTRLRKQARIPLSDLGKYPLILPSLPHAMRAAAETAAGRAGIKLNVVLQVEGTPFILALVQAGHGCTMLSRHVVQESMIRDLQVNEIIRPRIKRTTAIALSSQRRITHLTRETVKLIKLYSKQGEPTA
jgi:LysR family nitrogen assimilation transcriptional regulator